MATNKITLGEFGASHVWYRSTAKPAGCDLIAEDGEPLELDCGYDEEGRQLWWDLEGEIDTLGRWQWDGKDEPSDSRGNSVLEIVAFAPGGDA